MDTLSSEIVASIFDYACSDDFGLTARRLGLVCKYFRIIAEPIELRSVAVAGYEQLHGAVCRIRSFSRPDDVQRAVPVIHLFISEPTEEHALASDSYFDNGSRGTRGSFWRTDEGNRAVTMYDERTEEFWKLGVELVRMSSARLRTLFLLSLDNFYAWRGLRFRKGHHTTINTKAFGVLSSMRFPSLTSLTIDHDFRSEMRGFVECDSFRPPAMPSLRRLHIISAIQVCRKREDQEVVHPLLAFLFPDNHTLKQLVVCDEGIGDLENSMTSLFGRAWQSELQCGKLPGQLQSVILQQGIAPAFGCGTGALRYRRAAHNFVRAVKDLHVAGLEAHPPFAMVPDPGSREYEVLLADWKNLCHGDTS